MRAVGKYSCGNSRRLSCDSQTLEPRGWSPAGPWAGETFGRRAWAVFWARVRPASAPVRPPAGSPFRPAAARRRRARLAELSRSDLLPPWAAAGPAGRVWPARRSASSSRHPRGRFQRSAALPRPPLLHRLPLSYRANSRFSRTCLDPA